MSIDSLKPCLDRVKRHSRIDSDNASQSTRNRSIDRLAHSLAPRKGHLFNLAQKDVIAGKPDHGVGTLLQRHRDDTTIQPHETVAGHDGNNPLAGGPVEFWPSTIIDHFGFYGFAGSDDDHSLGYSGHETRAHIPQRCHFSILVGGHESADVVEGEESDRGLGGVGGAKHTTAGVESTNSMLADGRCE